MPELPEVETIRRGLEPFMPGRTIERVTLRRGGLRAPFPPDLAGSLEGRRVLELGRRAKYLLCHIEGGQCLAVHLGMSGRLSAHWDGADVQPGRHDHMILDLEGGARIVLNDPRRFGTVLLVESGGFSRHPAFVHLGPEPLDSAFDGRVIAAKLSGRRSPVKPALLDQRAVAGMGNIYASEALYEARIHPAQRSDTLRPDQTDKLADAIRAVLSRAIDAGGSSLRDYRRANGGLGYFQHSFAVYGREAEACPACGGEILKIVQSGRATFFCPECQSA